MRVGGKCKVGMGWRVHDSRNNLNAQFLAKNDVQACVLCERVQIHFNGTDALLFPGQDHQLLHLHHL